MAKLKKICIFIVLTLVLCSTFSVCAFAADALTEERPNEVTESNVDTNLGDKNNPLTFGERVEYAIQGTVTGMLMVFGVLTLLTFILYGSKFVFHDLPNRKREKKIVAQKAKNDEKATENQHISDGEPQSITATTDDGELVAVITAAVAAMIESEEYKKEFAGGFRVVSFKRSSKTAWNRK